MPQTTKKKDPDRTKGRPFPFPDQANKSFNCNKAETERRYVDTVDRTVLLTPIDAGDATMAIAHNIATRHSEHQKDVI